MSRMKPFLWGVGSTLLVLLVFALTLASERRSARPRMEMAAASPEPMAAAEGFGMGAGGAPPPPPKAVRMAPEMKKRGKGISIPHSGAVGSLSSKDAAPSAPAELSELMDSRATGVAVADAPGGDGGAAAAPSRAWFPETFLFEPLVVTDASGSATVPVRVPDRLTHWRVLALAHSREGAQAGATTSFLGTLPTYVDPVMPPFLMAGDEVRLPVQMVNTTAADVTQPLKVEAVGASVSGAGGAVRIPAEGSRVDYVTVRADAPGKVVVKTTLGDADAMVRSFDVLPTGRPITAQQGGSLGAPRAFSLEGPADPTPGSERVRLLVYPGALALLRAELSAASTRGGPAADAYALLLAGRAPELLRALGDAPDTETLRALAIVSGQRVLRASRTPDAGTAALFAEAAFAHPGNPVLTRLGERLSAKLAESQRPDGTCQGGTGWTLQRLLVATADCVRAARVDPGPAGRRRAQAVTLRAQGAFERNLERVQDGYTAAALLASGPLPASLAEPLRAKVREAIHARPDGSRFLAVEPETQRADGTRPGEVEATALAVLALQGEAKAPMADLGSFLLAGYVPGGGWGDGRTNLVCIQAALALFKDPLPAKVRLVLERDGKVITEGTLDAKAMRAVVAMEAAATGSAGTHAWTLRAEPAVPGLGFSLELSGWVPWKDEKASGGLELAITPPTQLQVDHPFEVTLSAVMPSGTPVRIRHALPAGVQVEPTALAALVSAGTLSSYQAVDGALILEVPARPPGETFRITYRVVPTFAGTLHAQASTIEPSGRPELAFHLAPSTWAVR